MTLYANRERDRQLSKGPEEPQDDYYTRRLLFIEGALRLTIY